MIAIFAATLVLSSLVLLVAFVAFIVKELFPATPRLLRPLKPDKKKDPWIEEQVSAFRRGLEIGEDGP